MNKKNVQERRDAVIDLYSEGRNQKEIAQKLKISQPTVHRDIRFEKERLRNKTDKYYTEIVPWENNACVVGMNKVLRCAWDIIHNGRDMDMDTHKKLMNGLNLAKECYMYKMKMLESEIVVKDVSKWFGEEIQKSHINAADEARALQYKEEERRRQAIF